MAVRQCVSAARSALFGAQRRRLGASHRRSAAPSLRDSRSCAAGTSRISHGRTLCGLSPEAACDARHGRCADAASAARRVAQRLRRLPPQNPRPLSAQGTRQVLARGLPKVCVLRLSSRRGWLYAVHSCQPHPLPPRLPAALWCDGKLRGMQQTHPSVRDGDACPGERLPPGLLCMPAL